MRSKDCCRIRRLHPLVPSKAGKLHHVQPLGSSQLHQDLGNYKLILMLPLPPRLRGNHLHSLHLVDANQEMRLKEPEPQPILQF